MQTKYIKLDDVIAILQADIQFNQQKKMKLEEAVKEVTGESLSTIADRLILDTAIKQSEALMNVFLDKLDVYYFAEFYKGDKYCKLNGEIIDENRT